VNTRQLQDRMKEIINFLQEVSQKQIPGQEESKIFSRLYNGTSYVELEENARVCFGLTDQSKLATIRQERPRITSFLDRIYRSCSKNVTGTTIAQTIVGLLSEVKNKNEDGCVLLIDFFSLTNRDSSTQRCRYAIIYIPEEYPMIFQVEPPRILPKNPTKVMQDGTKDLSNSKKRKRPEQSSTNNIHIDTKTATATISYVRCIEAFIRATNIINSSLWYQMSKRKLKLSCITDTESSEPSRIVFNPDLELMKEDTVNENTTYDHETVLEDSDNTPSPKSTRKKGSKPAAKKRRTKKDNEEFQDLHELL